MHRPLRVLLFAGMLATSMLAGTAARDVALPVEWQLEIQIGAMTTRIGATGTGVAIANGAGGPGALTSLELPAGMIAVAGALVDVDDPAAFPIEGMLLTVSNAAANFAIGSGGDLEGTMPLPGRERFCLFANCNAAVANLSVPLTVVGGGGVATNSGSVNLTVTGAAWTTGSATATGLGTTMATGYAHGPASAAGSTARVGGSLQLVTPFTVGTNIAADGPLTAFAFLTLRFVPEPASALLVASGLVALARWGRSRR